MTQPLIQRQISCMKEMGANIYAYRFMYVCITSLYNVKNQKKNTDLMLISLLEGLHACSKLPTQLHVPHNRLS